MGHVYERCEHNTRQLYPLYIIITQCRSLKCPYVLLNILKSPNKIILIDTYCIAYNIQKDGTEEEEEEEEEEETQSKVIYSLPRATVYTKTRQILH